MEEIFSAPIEISFQRGNNLFLAIASEVSGSRKNCFPFGKRPYNLWHRKNSLSYSEEIPREAEKILGCEKDFFDALRFRAYSKKKISRGPGFS